MNAIINEIKGRRRMAEDEDDGGEDDGADEERELGAMDDLLSEPVSVLADVRETGDEVAGDVDGVHCSGHDVRADVEQVASSECRAVL